MKLSELFNPSDKQKEFLKMVDAHKYTLFGGAKGGGKSYILRWALVRLLLKWASEGHTNVRTTLFCEDYPALRDRQIVKIQSEFPSWLGTLSESNVHGMAFVLKPEFGGGIIALRNLDDPSKFASSEMAACAVDELTKNPEDVFNQLRSIIRWPGITDTKFLAGTNPGGIGHEWVMRRWVTREFDSNEPEPEQFAFVQAFARDNPHLSANYVLSLQGLPENLRKAYLDGDWDLWEGQYFPEWRKDLHVCTPFEIPTTWKRIRATDHGRAKPTACLWGAVDYDGCIYWYREYYMAGVDADVNAKRIAELSVGERYWFSVMDSACYSKTGSGETIADIYANNKVFNEPWPKNRLAGWALFHEYLRVQPIGMDGQTVDKPKMVFFSNCANSIRTIPTLVFDDKAPEDLDSTGEDHAADAVRGALEYLNEGKSPKPLAPMEQRLRDLKRQGRVGPGSLNRFYGRRG